jgi:enolase
MAAIEKVFARSIFDSRGNPTVEVDMWADGVMSRASVPSGASTGAYEAVELRDDSNPRYMGKGVQTAVDNVNKLIAPKIIGMDPADQMAIDKLMLEIDGTENKVSRQPGRACPAHMGRAAHQGAGGWFHGEAGIDCLHWVEWLP